MPASRPVTDLGDREDDVRIVRLDVWRVPLGDTLTLPQDDDAVRMGALPVLGRSQLPSALPSFDRAPVEAAMALLLLHAGPEDFRCRNDLADLLERPGAEWVLSPVREGHVDRRKQERGI